MKILVTGGAGYVGWSVVHELASTKEVKDIVVYDNLSRNNYGLLLGQRPRTTAKIKVVVDELLNCRGLSHALRGVDCVIHLAAIAPSPDTDNKPHFFDQVNHWGTAELGYAVEQQGVPRLVYLSSGAVYGHPEGIATIDTVPLPVTAYGRSKLAGERQLQRLSSKLDLRIIRAGTVYGVNPSVRFDTFVNRFLLDASLGRPLNVHGSGEQVRPIVPVDEVARFVVSAALQEEHTGLSHAVATNTSVNEVVAGLRRSVSGLEVIYINQQQRLNDLKMSVGESRWIVSGKEKENLSKRLKKDRANLSISE